jgi:PAS domain S-box-containing protein
MLLYYEYKPSLFSASKVKYPPPSAKGNKRMICRWTPDEKLTFANEAFCRFFECTRSELIEDSLESCILEEDACLMKSSLARLNREKPYTGVECRFRIGGEIRWTHWTHQAFFDDEGSVREIQSVVSDMSRQKRIEKNLRKEKNYLEQRIRDRTAELEAKHKELGLKNLQIKRLVRKTQDAMEADRRTIAKELHDSIGASLAAIKFSLEQRLSEMNGVATSGHLPFEKILTYLSDTIKETKRISQGLRPSTLDDLGLLVTLEEHTQKLHDIYPDIDFVQHFDIEERHIPEPLKIVVYRVVQEALNNACKHSGANKVSVTLVKEDNQLILNIRDNGCGFDISALNHNKKMLEGYGIENMRDRIEIFDGRFNIESGPNKGTCLSVYLPCHSNRAT